MTKRFTDLFLNTANFLMFKGKWSSFTLVKVHRYCQVHDCVYNQAARNFSTHGSF